MNAALHRVEFVEQRLRSVAAGLSESFGWLYLVAAVIIAANVISRRFLGFSFFGITDLGGYLLAVGIVFGLGHTLATNGHIRVDVVVRKIPFIGVRSVLHTLALAALTGFAVLMTARGWAVLERSVRLGTRDLSALEIPVAIPQSLWVFALAAFSVLAVVMLLKCVVLLVLGDHEAIDRMFSGAEESEAAALVAEVAEVTRSSQDERERAKG